ncbi:MAG: PIG-L family deacetylase [Verrucomicrobiota bacterium]
MSETPEPFTLNHPEADTFVPGGTAPRAELGRTTHLCVGAHQDDIEIMAYHGIAACYADPDKAFSGVVVTDGAGSSRAGPYADHTDAAMREVRRQEQRTAAALGRYAVQFQLGYSSSAVKPEPSYDLVEDLRQIFTVARPEVLYLHNPADKHDTHVAVLVHCLQALRLLPPEDRPKRIYGCEVWRSLDWLPDDAKVALPVDAQPGLQASLLQVFASQIAGGKRYDLAVAGRQQANATFHQSHEVDRVTAVTWALDMTLLIKDDGLSLEKFIQPYLQRLSDDVCQRLRRLSE